MRFSTHKTVVSLLALAFLWCISDTGHAEKKKDKLTHAEIIVLDLGEAGVEMNLELETSAVTAGQKHMIGWLDSASEDAFLVIDATALEKKGWHIEERDTANRLSGYVIFSTGHALRDPSEKRWNYKRLMVLLSAFDENKDKKIDQSDWVYSILGLYRDTNSNGQVDAGEVSKLPELQVGSIRLFMAQKKEKDSFDNVHQVIKVEKSDGSDGEAHLVRLKLR